MMKLALFIVCVCGNAQALKMQFSAQAPKPDNTCYVPFGDGYTLDQWVGGEMFPDGYSKWTRPTSEYFGQAKSHALGSTAKAWTGAEKERFISDCQKYKAKIENAHGMDFDHVKWSYTENDSTYNKAALYWECDDENWWRNMAQVKWFVKTWNHAHSGTGSYHIESWMNLCAGLSAQGDPHVVNIQGQKFDIVSLGDVELIRYPQNASDSQAKLIITTTIDKLGAGCHDAYMKRVKMSGSWLETPVLLKDDEDTGDILVQGMKFSTSSESPQWMRKNSSNSFQLHGMETKFENTRRLSFKMAAGPTVVVYAQGRPHKGHGTFLNLDFRGFAQLPGSVGGILGLDSHQHELDLAKDMCKKQSAPVQNHSVFALHQETNLATPAEEENLFSITIE